MLHILWRHCDEDTVESRSEGTGSVLAATRREAGEGEQVSPKGTARPKPSRMGGKRSAGLAHRTARVTR